jgi:hypothetical protein
MEFLARPEFLVSWADISAWPKDKILLKHSKRLHDKNFGQG